MASSTIRTHARRFVLTLLVVAPITAAVRFVMLPASVTVIGPVIAGDTSTHVDLFKTRTAQLRSIALSIRGDTMREPVKWSSGNTAVASISTSGVVTAKKRGYATITATVAGISGRLRVCVTDRERESLTWSVLSNRVTFNRERLQPRQTMLATAHVTLKPGGATQWGECVHWQLDSASREFARIDRAGVLHSSRSVANIYAAVGPSLPR